MRFSENNQKVYGVNISGKVISRTIISFNSLGEIFQSILFMHSL